jgi:hypothetical protein
MGRGGISYPLGIRGVAVRAALAGAAMLTATANFGTAAASDQSSLKLNLDFEPPS